jgi:chemotaxis protein MotB
MCGDASNNILKFKNKMNMLKSLTASLFVIALLSSCVSKKTLQESQDQLAAANEELSMTKDELNDYKTKASDCEGAKANLETELSLRQEQITDLKGQISDLKNTLSQQMIQVGELTVLSKAANDNISKTLGQLNEKDEYIKYIQAAKTKADSMNLALAVNLKSVLKDGIADEDIEVMIDKTVVFINLSDKMLYKTGKATLTPRAEEVLGKIAQIVENKPGFEVMVEGYTDNKPISRPGIKDNWDLSVLRATSVVRVLEEKYNIDPNRLIAAGRGEHNTLASNDTEEGRSKNRRTRIIILPKLGEFYDLLDGSSAIK